MKQIWPADSLKISVVVATLGRRAEAQDLVSDLANQSRPPDRVIFAVVDQSDAPDCSGHANFEVLMCDRRGSCAQRNIAIDCAADSSDIIVFFDDDFVPERAYLEQLERRFAEDAEVVGLTGLVVADGVTGPGLSREGALAAIERHVRAWPEGDTKEARALGLYGCNMAVRTAALGERRFDENLPLYGWLEDIDLTSQLRDTGELIRSNALVGAHRGVKRARTPGVRLGYSQIANPIYLLRKGTVPARYMYENMLRNLAANLVKSIRPEPYIDRRGRLKGNFIGLLDILRGQSSPRRVLDL